MFELDSWMEIWYSIRKNPLRSFMTGLGVLWGMLMLIVMLGSGNGLKNGVAGDLKNFATNSVYLWAMKTTKAYGGFQPGRFIRLTNEDVEAVRANVPNIDVLAPRNQLGGYGDNNNVSRGNRSGGFTVMGDYPIFAEVTPPNMVGGRFLNDFDIKDLRKVCVIGNRVREVLFAPNEDPVGQSIEIQGVHFTVVGMFESNKGRMAARESQTIYIPFTTFQKAFNYGNQVGWFTILANKSVSPEKVEEDVKTYLAERHKIHPEDKMAFGSFTASRFIGKMDMAFSLINIVVWVVGFFSLVAGIIGISNIMIVVVKERTKEIGVKRALGARPWHIVKQITAEAFVLTALSGYLGLVAGIVLLEKADSIMRALDLSDEYFKNPEVDFGIAVKALILLIVAGIIAGLLPGIRASRIKPIEALREE